jgi:hypothetical protein
MAGTAHTMIITFSWEGKERTANIEEVEGDFETMFSVTMDDGYLNIFFTVVGQPYVWYEANMGNTELAQVIGRAIEKHFF